MAYAFIFDESSCSGCKACQVACKDKNKLPLGVLWRRVYEVTGGEWKRSGETWLNTVFAYNLSIACNHCIYPKCAGVCPVDAYEVRSDGIVLINVNKCIGCGYCAWACPYDAPQIDRNAGYVTKCNLCYDNLDADLPPACVSACPLRCLSLVESNDPGIDDQGLILWEIPGSEHPFPLPQLSRTEPHLIIKPHTGVKQVGEGTQVSNREETSPAMPRVNPTWEIPLIIFTLLAQMAIGSFLTISMLYWMFNDKTVIGQITIVPLLAIAAIISTALLVSLFHLGTPKKAWRVLNHLRKSWLSREILFVSVFAGLCAILTGLRIFNILFFPVWIIITVFNVCCGLVALYCMQRVYQLRSLPAWNSARTFLEFSISTLGLGSFLTGILLPKGLYTDIIGWFALTGILVFLAAGTVTISNMNSENMEISRWRSGLILAGLLVTVILLFWPSIASSGCLFLIFIITSFEEVIGRWLFYSRRNPGI